MTNLGSIFWRILYPCSSEHSMITRSLSLSTLRLRLHSSWPKYICPFAYFPKLASPFNWLAIWDIVWQSGLRGWGIDHYFILELSYILKGAAVRKLWRANGKGTTIFYYLRVNSIVGTLKPNLVNYAVTWIDFWEFSFPVSELLISSQGYSLIW